MNRQSGKDKAEKATNFTDLGGNGAAGPITGLCIRTPTMIINIGGLHFEGMQSAPTAQTPQEHRFNRHTHNYVSAAELGDQSAGPPTIIKASDPGSP